MGWDGHLQSMSGCELLNGISIYLFAAQRKESRRTRQLNQKKHKHKAVLDKREEGTQNLPATGNADIVPPRADLCLGSKYLMSIEGGELKCGVEVEYSLTKDCSRAYTTVQ